MDSLIYIIGGSVIIMALMITGLVIEEQHWQKFAAEHHCVEVAREPGYYTYDPVTSLSMDGKSMTTTIQANWHPDVVTYACDDGNRYRR